MSATETDGSTTTTEAALSDATAGAATARNFVLNTRPLAALRKLIRRTM